MRNGDGGETWSAVINPEKSTLLSIQFLNDDDGWAIGRGGIIMRSGDGGRTWTHQASTTKQNLYALFVDKKVGWAVGSRGLILKYPR